MNEATARALAAINTDFYRDHAAEFSATRTAPWPGWERLAARAARRAGRAAPCACSTSAAAMAASRATLAEALAPRALALCGVDASEPLLDAGAPRGPARRALAARRRGRGSGRPALRARSTSWRCSR